MSLLSQWPIRSHWKASVGLTYQLGCRERPPFCVRDQSKNLAGLLRPYDKLNISIALGGIFESFLEQSLSSALQLLISPFGVCQL
jgi:hypothetical protein